LLLNTFYFENLPFLSEGLDAPFNLGSIMKTIIRLGMNATIDPMWTLGERREELLKTLK
jgi:hypothetical protein